MKILFVCLGNICRSPCAHAVLQKLKPKWEIESCGTSSYHLGEEMDSRMQQTLADNGITFSHPARKFSCADFATYDHIICMDEKNKFTLLMQAESEEEKKKVKLLRDFDPVQTGNVPDPYYEDNFEEVFEIIKRCCEELAQQR